MERIMKMIERVSNWSGILPAFLIYPGMMILVYEVISRYIFNAPTLWAHGVSQRIFCIYLVIGAPYVLYQRGHIRMDLIYNLFSSRTKAIVDIVTSPILFAIIFVLIYFGWDFAWTSIRSLEVDGTPLHAPVWPFKIWLPITGILLLLQAVANFYRDLVTLMRSGK